MSFLRKIEKREKAWEKTPERASTESVNTGGKIYIRLNFFGIKINLVIFICIVQSKSSEGSKRRFERKTCSCAIIAKIFFKNRPSKHISMQ